MSQLTSSIKENPKLRAAAEELKKAGIKVGDAVGEALRTMEESEVARAVRDTVLSVLPPASLTYAVDLEGFCRSLVDHREVYRANT